MHWCELQAELPDLHRDLGDAHCERVAADAAPPSAPLGVWLSPDQLSEAETRSGSPAPTGSLRSSKRCSGM